jgi:hypothetical protein
LEDQIYPTRKFSSFLIMVLVLFEGFSLALVMGLSYWMLSRSMTLDFFHTLQAQETEAGAILHDRLSRLESRVRELSLNNAVRVSLMLGVRSQLLEIVDKQYCSEQGVVCLVREREGGIFVPGLPDRLKALEGFLTKLAGREKPESVRFMRVGAGRYLSVFYAPIMRKDDHLGSAFVLYDLSLDDAYWLRLGLYPGSELLVGVEKNLIDLHTGEQLAIPEVLHRGLSGEDPAIACTHRIPGKGIMPLKGFPGIFYMASSTPLHKKKMALMFMLGLVCVAIFSFTFLVAIFLARKMSRPLEDIAAQAIDIAEHPSKVFLREDNIKHLEFRKLVRAFNLLLASLLHVRQKLNQKGESRLDEDDS